MTPPEQVVARVFGLPSSAVTDSTSNVTVSAWDSLSHMTLVLELEAAYGIALSTDEALAITDVLTIKRVLGEHGVRWAGD